MSDPEVRAAGGVVWRPTAAGHPEVLLVHRPRYDDWSLPKGKLDAGEDFVDAAVREIAEETGVVGRLGPSLGSVHYPDHLGRAKEVRWWALEAVSQTAPTDVEEVDEMRWMPVGRAIEQATYPTDVAVLERFRDTVIQ